MDCMLGEGQFGEVYKGMIKGIVNNPYFQTSNVSFVAVKILRRKPWNVFISMYMFPQRRLYTRSLSSWLSGLCSPWHICPRMLGLLIVHFTSSHVQ